MESTRRAALIRAVAVVAVVGLALVLSRGSSWFPPGSSLARQPGPTAREREPGPAAPGLGDLLSTVTLPGDARCLGPLNIGTSVAIVPGSMIGLKQYPILLVTSCYQYQTSSLFFLNPGTEPATLVKTISTNPTPTSGWGALSLRGDKGDLIGCGNEDLTAPVYAIDIDPYNATADGAATFLFNAAAQFGICDGVAWDTGDDTIFQSPDVSDTIYHYGETGAFLGTLTSPCSTNSGLAVGGPSLFAACNGTLVIYQMDKTNGQVVTSFGTAGSRTEDLECDPVTFAAMNKDAMWSKDAYTNELFAFEIPQGTCGFAGGPPVVPPSCSTDPDHNGDTDNDGDALCDSWETDGIDWDGDTTIDLELYDVDKDGTIEAGEDADPDHKDIYVEADWMAQHQPNATALNNVIASFANAPVANPDGESGIRLHVQTDEQAVAHNNSLAFEPCTGPAGVGTPDFDDVKLASWGTAAERASPNSVKLLNAKRWASRYSLFAHNLLGLGGTSGCAELPGNDMVVSLGSWAVVGGHGQGNTDQQGGTFMHEFGHNLSLRHGGSDNVNCKPNYLSVMSYSRQINNNPIPNRPLDYSRSGLAALDETALSEPAGIGGPAGNQTAYGPPPVLVAPANQPIDWNRDGDSADAGVAANINNHGFGGCGGSGSDLQGHDDWTNLQYDFRSTVDFADGVHLSAPSSDEIVFEEALQASPDSDGDGLANLLDNCPFAANPGQEDADDDGIGNLCEPGDVDCNGAGDAVDALLVLRDVAGLAHSAACLGSGDINCDNTLTSVDALAILRHVALLPPLATPPGCPAIDL